MKIISYNLNGIRAAIKKGLWDWVAAEQPDVFCVQETKAMQSDIGALEYEALGYQVYWHAAEKKGYSGVATFCKTAPDKVVVGCGIPKYDAEGRVLRTDFGDMTILNCYFPSGSSGDERQAFKMEFLSDITPWIHALRKERPNLIVLGDYNIAHTERDIHDPKGNKKSSGFLPEERQWMSEWLSAESGFVDAFRHVRPEEIQYSWWSARFNSRANNKGWRIDYQCVTGNIVDRIIDTYQGTDIVHSDHCPVILDLK